MEKDYGIEIVQIGFRGEHRRYKVVDANGEMAEAPTGEIMALFKTEIEAENHIAALRAANASEVTVTMTRDEANTIVELISGEIERINDFDIDDRRYAEYDPEEVADWLTRLRSRILATEGVH